MLYKRTKVFSLYKKSQFQMNFNSSLSALMPERKMRFEVVGLNLTKPKNSKKFSLVRLLLCSIIIVNHKTL